jgi:hypothetical protein
MFASPAKIPFQQLDNTAFSRENPVLLTLGEPRACAPVGLTGVMERKAPRSSSGSSGGASFARGRLGRRGIASASISLFNSETSASYCSGLNASSTPIGLVISSSILYQSCSTSTLLHGGHRDPVGT